MALNDPLGDLFTRIRNAQMRSKAKISTPGSRLRASVLEVLKNEGYIRGYSTTEYGNGRTEFEIERVSKPGRRVYASVRNLPRINNGLGMSVLSTPKGIMADHDAREANVGGEVLFTVF